MTTSISYSAYIKYPHFTCFTFCPTWTDMKRDAPELSSKQRQCYFVSSYIVTLNPFCNKAVTWQNKRTLYTVCNCCRIFTLQYETHRGDRLRELVLYVWSSVSGLSGSLYTVCGLGLYKHSRFHWYFPKPSCFLLRWKDKVTCYIRTFIFRAAELRACFD